VCTVLSGLFQIAGVLPQPVAGCGIAHDDHNAYLRVGRHTLDDRVRVLRAGRDPVKNVLEQDSGIKKDPASIKALAKEYILPHIDFLTLSQWVLGTYWREAAPEQPQTFMAEFQELLLRTYGVALAESSDQHLEFLFLRAGAVSNPVTVDARFE